MSTDTYYKAVHPDGTDFYSGTVTWVPEGGIPDGGWLVEHADRRQWPPGAGLPSHARYYLSVATVATDCTGMRWPARLLRVEAVAGDAVWTPDGSLPHKCASLTWRVVEELPAWQALGPQGREVAALIERIRAMSASEAAAARDAAWDAAWDAARAAAWAAAWALIVRDLIPADAYTNLTAPLRSVIGDTLGEGVTW